MDIRKYPPTVTLERNDGKTYYRATFKDFPDMIGGIGNSVEKAIEAGYEMLDAEIVFREEMGMDVPEPAIIDLGTPTVEERHRGFAKDYGLPPDVAAKALIDGLYTNWGEQGSKPEKGPYVTYDREKKVLVVSDPSANDSPWEPDPSLALPYSDYGKTWALTKEELEESKRTSLVLKRKEEE